nr:unnamed protein product [Spirometra erinaceieuropaei]
MGLACLFGDRYRHHHQRLRLLPMFYDDLHALLVFESNLRTDYPARGDCWVLMGSAAAATTASLAYEPAQTSPPPDQHFPTSDAADDSSTVRFDDVYRVLYSKEEQRR